MAIFNGFMRTHHKKKKKKRITKTSVNNPKIYADFAEYTYWYFLLSAVVT